uniref:PPUP9157 n=1 Tax=Poeciliopsis prolifica TaxID=188132 RepID=A0A0S7EJB6_9TELE
MRRQEPCSGSEFSWCGPSPITCPSSRPRLLPSLSLPPRFILVFIAQSSTQLSIHSLCASSNTEGGETRVKQDRKGQSVSDRSGFFQAFVLAVLFWVLFYLLQKAKTISLLGQSEEWAEREGKTKNFPKKQDDVEKDKL